MLDHLRNLRKLRIMLRLLLGSLLRQDDLHGGIIQSTIGITATVDVRLRHLGGRCGRARAATAVGRVGCKGRGVRVRAAQTRHRLGTCATSARCRAGARRVAAVASTRAVRRRGVSVVGARVEVLELALLFAAGSVLGLDASETLDATQGALVLGDNLFADGRQEDVELAVEVLLGDAELPLEEHEELLLHQVDLGL